MSLVSPGVSVSVIDESQYASNVARDTIPLVVLATHENKATPSGTNVAPLTQKSEANELHLITSPRELVQQFGNPVFYDVNGTPQQGYDLNEYGLLAAYKALNVTNRVYVVRGDIDLGQLLPRSIEPTSDPLANTYWFDLANTKFGIFKFNAANDEWELVTPTILNTPDNLSGSAPSNNFGKNGDVVVVTLNNATTNGVVKVYEKISGFWRVIGSDSWDSAAPTVAIGDNIFNSASNQTLSGLPQAGDTIVIDVDSSGSPVTVTLETTVQGTNNLVTANSLALKTVILNGTTVTLGTTSGANITGTADFATNTESTGVSIGDILQIQDTAGTDNISMRLKVESSGYTGALSGTLVINGQNIDLTGVTDIASYVTAVNDVVGTSGTSPQGITASNSGGELRLIKDSNPTGGSNPNQIVIDTSGVTGTDGLTDGTTNMDVSQVVESINDQLSNTDNITATVNGSGPYNVRIADSGSGLKVQNVFGTPRNDLGLSLYSAVPLADIETELETVSDIEVDDSADNDVPTTGNALKLIYTGSGDLVIGNGTANTELGLTAGNYRVSLNSVVSQVNASDANGGWSTSFNTTTGGIRTEDGVSQFTVSNGDSNPFTISGTGATKLGIVGTFTSSQLYLESHVNAPSNPQDGDFWIKTTTPNDGANYSVKYWDASTGQWVLSQAPMYENNQTAFDKYSTDLSTGDLYVQYNADESNPEEAAFKIYRYNGNTSLELVINNFVGYTGQNIQISNGRDALATVSIDDEATLVGAINGLNQDNLEAELNSSGNVVIKNTAGEDIVLADGGVAITAVTSNQFTASTYTNWVALRAFTIGNVTGYEASFTAPVGEAEEGQLWFNASVSKDDFDLLQKDGGSNQWVTFSGDVQIRVSKPSTRSDGTSALVNGDIWISTADLDEFPMIYKWNAGKSKWVMVDNADQTTQNGILFADARPTSTANLDPDAPNPILYPAGMLLWNTRASSMVVKEYRPNWFGDESEEGQSFDGNDYTAQTYDVGNDTFAALTSAGRWVTVSGNESDGSPYMGRLAQRIMIVRAMAGALASNEDLRDVRRNYFNLMLAPGYPELIDEMISLNIDRRETAFIITDTPARLRNNSTEIQDWSTNANNAVSTGDKGLTSLDEYSAAYYPPMGITTNLDGNEVAMPSSLGALYAYIYNDTVSAPWFAPAGLQRGILSGVFASVGYITAEDEYKPAQVSRGLQDTLYVNKLNPITFTPGRGLYINGQKTLSSQTSALDRVNVARLIVYLRYQIELLAEEFLFEINDDITRDQVKNTFDRFLGDLIGQRAIYDFLVVCDETNNTPERIDRNELWIDIAIQPAKAIEFIYVPIRVKNTGEDLTA